MALPLRKLTAIAAAWLSFGLASASPAAAGVPVELRSQPQAAGSAVALGDLFDNAGAAARVVVGSAAAGATTLVLDAGQVQRVAHVHGLDWDNSAGFRRIVVGLQADIANAPQPGPSNTPARLRPGQTVNMLVYARNLAAGDIVQPQDLIWIQAQAQLAPGDAASDADQAIGLSARRPLRQGSAVAAHDLAAPIVVRRDELITVAYVTDGVELTIQGKAMADAAVGQAVEVINLQSKKSISAVAVEPGRAVTGPGAQAERRTLALR